MLFCSLEKTSDEWLAMGVEIFARKNEALSIDNHGVELKYYMPPLIT